MRAAVLLAVSLSAPAAFASETSNPAASVVDEARRLVKAGQCPASAGIASLLPRLQQQSLGRDWVAVDAGQLLGRAHRCGQRFDAAIGALLRARSRANSLFRRADAGDRASAAAVMIALELELSETYRSAGSANAAIPPLQNAARMARQHLPSSPDRDADIEFRIGLAALDAADLDQSEAALARAEALLTQDGPTTSELAARIALNRAKIAFERGAPLQAQKFADQARLAFGERRPVRNAAAFDTEIQLARAALDALDYDSAHERLDRVLLGLEATEQGQSQAYADAQYFLGELELMRGCYASAEDFTRQSLVLYRGLRSQSDPVFARGLHRLGILCERMDDPAGAVSAFDAALARLSGSDRRHRLGETAMCGLAGKPAVACGQPESFPNLSDPAAARTLIESTQALGRCGYHRAALERADTAIALLDEDPDSTGQDRALAQAAKGAALFRAGDRADAEAVLELAVAMMAEETGGDHEDMPPSLYILAQIAMRKAELASDPSRMRARALRLAERSDRILVARRAAPSQRRPVLTLLAELEGSPIPPSSALHCRSIQR